MQLYYLMSDLGLGSSGYIKINGSDKSINGYV